MTNLTLLTFPPSLDSELARFVLHHYEVEHREERHVMPISSFYSLVHGWSPRFPLLYGDGVRCYTVHQIVEHCEKRADPAHKLIPADLDAVLRDDWKLLHHKLNSGTTVLAYHYLLPRRDLMVRGISEGSPAWEVRAVARAYPAFAGFIRLLLRPTDKRAAAALDHIRTILDGVDARLADGRRYLHGDRLTLADITFATATAPVVWPDGYGGPLPPLAQTPAGLQAAVAECRARPSGEFALRIYADHR
jgi:glutathione S-transferase